MRYEIHGTVMQSVDVYLSRGEAVFTEAGGMAWMAGAIEMKTDTRGGVLAGLGRKLAGESLFMTTYTCTAPQGIIAFANEFPGKIIPVPLAAGESRICQKDAFMCAERTVQLEMHFRKKLGAGLFGGEGFIMQKLTGPGLAFVELAGEIIEYDLQPGQALKVDTGHIAMFEPTVTFDVVTVKGVKNVLFGGEGLFLAHVSGPGKVWLQSMPVANLAAKISQHIPKGS